MHAPDPDEDKHLLETIGMFVTYGIHAVAELEEEVLALDGAKDQTAPLGVIRRTPTRPASSSSTWRRTPTPAFRSVASSTRWARS